MPVLQTHIVFAELNNEEQIKNNVRNFLIIINFIMLIINKTHKYVFCLDLVCAIQKCEREL